MEWAEKLHESGSILKMAVAPPGMLALARPCGCWSGAECGGDNYEEQQ